MHLFQQPSADELIHGLANGFGRNVCRQVNSAMRITQQGLEAIGVKDVAVSALRSQTNASPFWIMLLLVWGQTG